MFPALLVIPVFPLSPCESRLGKILGQWSIVSNDKAASGVVVCVTCHETFKHS